MDGRAGEADIAAINTAMEGAPAALLAQIESSRPQVKEDLRAPSDPQSLAVGRQYDIVLEELGPAARAAMILKALGKR